MNKKTYIVLVILTLVFTKTLSAQAHLKDSTDTYNYWVRRGIIEMVYAYMNDYIETVGDSHAKNEIIGMKKFKEYFIEGLEKNNLPEFSEISTFLLNNSWKGAEKKLFQPLLKNYKNHAELTSDFFEINKPGSNNLITDIPGKNNKKINWNKKKQEILQKYNNQLTKIAEAQEVREKLKEQNKSDKIRANKRKLQNQEEIKLSQNTPQWIIYLAVFILGCLIGSYLIFIISKNRIYSLLKSEKKNYLQDIKGSNKRFIFNYIGVCFVLKNHKDEYKKQLSEIINDNSKIKNFNGKFDELKNENFRLKQEIENLKQNSKLADINQENRNNKEVTVEQPKPVKHKLFFSMPENDGRFIIANGKTSNDGRKYFRIEYYEGAETGEVFFITGDRDKRTINRLETYLKPVCDIENILNADSANNIELLKSGKVILMNDSWLIDVNNRIKIKLY